MEGVLMANGDETQEAKAPNTWLAFASKYGFPGIVVFLMSGLIYIMFNFIATTLTTQLSNVNTKLEKLIDIHGQEKVLLEQGNKLLQDIKDKRR